MFFANFILKNYVMFFELIGLLIVLHISAHISARMKRQTRLVVALLFAETLFFTLERWSQTFETLSLLRPMMTAAMYTIYPVILLCLMPFTPSKLLTRRRMLLLLIPEIVSVPLCFTSQWTHLVCWYHEPNTYTGGPLNWWPYLVFAFYTVVFLINTLVYFKSYARSNHLILSYVIFGSGFGVLLYLLMNSENDYGGLFTSAIVLYYICIYIHMAKIDPLTQLLNRQSYYEDIRAHADAITGVVSADMNELKYVNDIEGHEAGDRAIATIAEALRANCGRGGTVYRVGGDEFMIFYAHAGEQEIIDAIAEIRRALRQTPYTCAFGYAMKEPDQPLHDVICLSDERMYADKAAIKKKTLEQGGTLHGRA